MSSVNFLLDLLKKKAISIQIGSLYTISLLLSFFYLTYFFYFFDSLRTYNSDLKNYAVAEDFKNYVVAYFKNYELADLRIQEL